MKKLIFIILLLSIPLLSQDLDTSRKIVIEKVLVNSKIKKMDEGLIFSRDDTLSFNYFLDKGENEKTPFLFRVVLEMSSDSAVTVFNEPIIRYQKLPEDIYTLSISAFDLKREWYTKIESVQFKVDDDEALLIKEIKALKDTLVVRDSTIINLSSIEHGSSLIDQIIFATIGFILGLIVFFVLSKFVLSSSNNGPVAQKDNIRNNVSRLQSENTRLKKELEALRGQVNGLQQRSEEMRERNRELEESVNLLSNSKTELENLQTQKDELFAMLIHDIKNPAGIIKSLVELLRSYDLSAIDQQKIIEDIINTTTKIMSLSNEVARVLALESGNMRMEFGELSLTKLAREILDRFLVKAKEKQILLMYEVPDDLPKVYGDEGRLDEVISNLVSNAIKFTQNGGTVRIKGDVIDDSVVIEVSDNGQGLSQEDLTNAFKKGAQLSAKPTAGETSTGLGLWIVKKLVEAHNGRVWVRSSLGKGSTFAFSLPLKQTASSGFVNLNQ